LDNIDEIAERLQNALFAGYSKRLKEELFSTLNTGAMENPDSHVRITGVCGDTIEMFLRVRGEKIHQVKFLTDGCGFTVACANYVARTTKGKSIEEALGIEQDEIDRYFEGLPEEHKHCAKLAVITLRALLENYCDKSKLENPDGADAGE
jgi:nitrogen fixation NifU-like protein